MIAAAGGFPSMGFNRLLNQMNLEDNIFEGSLKDENYKENIKMFFLELKKHYTHPEGHIGIVYQENEFSLFDTLRNALRESGISFIDISEQEFRKENFTLQKKGSL